MIVIKVTSSSIITRCAEQLVLFCKILTKSRTEMKLKELTTQLTYFFSILQMPEEMGLSDPVRQLLSEQKRSK